MATQTRQVLNVNGGTVSLYVGPGTTRVGFGLTGTWVGTATFYGSTDGINFVPISVGSFPQTSPATTSQTATANGNWETASLNYVAFRVSVALTSGSLTVVMAASGDSSYQDAFLAASSQFVSQSVAGGATNVVTQAAQANRAWRLRSLSVGFSAAASGAVDIKVTDGASTVLWEGYIPPSLNAISGGGTFNVPLPPIEPAAAPSVATGGVVGTPGNSMVVTLAAPGGSVVSTLNCEFVPA